MSFDFEESPLSDNKMDISDSVSAEEESGANVENAENYVESNETLMGLEYEIQKALPLLDNRIGRPEVLLEPVLKTNSAARTLANSHPLMSPATDSDSEEQNYKAGIDIKCHNFPDVVPCSERLQTANANTVLTRNTLNRVRGNVNTTPSHNKLSILRAHSPDLLSSESEADVSQYHAAVEANCQTVALKSNGQRETDYSEVHRINKIGNTLIGCEDISSLDSISNQSFEDDDIEHNLASLSPSSSLMDGLGDDNNDNDCEELEPNFLEVNTPTPNKALDPLSSIHEQSLPQYSAVEEHRNSRNWQKITLPDGRVREIDMRVIEPYKRVLSHGGYLKAGGHNAIVMFCACHLPDHSRADYNYVMDNLFLYVVKTLEQLVTEDYVLIYLHGGSSRRNMPTFPWLKKCYQLLDHRLRKSLKNMYLVHPTFWIKSIVWMTRPFVSAKFWRKLVYVKSLEELSAYVAVERAAIPEKVKLYDARHN